MCSSKYKKERKKNCCSTNSQRYCRQGGVIVTDQGLEPFDDRRTIQLKHQVKVTRQKKGGVKEHDQQHCSRGSGILKGSGRLIFQ